MWKRPASIKHKYHSKVLSDEAIYVNWIRCMDVADLFREYVWMDIPIFDLTLLGLGLFMSILPIEFKPFTVDFEYKPPNIDEYLQGIYAKFTPVIYEVKYDFLIDWEKFSKTVIKPEHQEDIIKLQYVKGKYDLTTYGSSIFDPILARKFISEVFNRMRLERKVDVSFQYILEKISTHVAISEVVVEETVKRFILLSSAQFSSFLLGISPLGKSMLSTRRNDFAVILLPDGAELCYRTLDHLQIGFILGVTSLGYGLLLPRDGIYLFDSESKSVPVLKPTVDKVIGMINRIGYTAYAYANYNKPMEMIDYHKSERTHQYDLLQEYRRRIEEWVYNTLSSIEFNPIKIRQYQNAVLQAVCWRAKRHAWGYEPFKLLTEEQYRDWWIDYWSGQGLDKDILMKFYDAMWNWVQALRQSKLYVGERVSEARYRLAGSVKP